MNKRNDRITHLNNDYINQKNHDRLTRKGRFKRIKAMLFFGTVILVAMIVPLVRNQIQARQINQEAELASQNLEELNEHQAQLRGYISLLNDEDYVKKLARSEYYVSGDHEIIFSLPEDQTPAYQELIESQRAKEESMANDEN